METAFFKTGLKKTEGQSKEAKPLSPRKSCPKTRVSSLETEVGEEEKLREGRLASRFILEMLLYKLTRAASSNAVAGG